MSSADTSTGRLCVEDDSCCVGAAASFDDAPLPGQVCGCFVRSTHASAKIRGIDAAGAKAASGVLAVLTAADMKARGASAGSPVTLR